MKGCLRQLAWRHSQKGNEKERKKEIEKVDGIGKIIYRSHYFCFVSNIEGFSDCI